MKARNREINIFNMSLLDVLCGALGAFCFMMLVLFPYYKPQQESNHNPPPPPPQNCEQCMQQHEQMQKRMDDLDARNTQLEMRNPVTVEMIPRITGYDIDLYINDDRQGPNGLKTPAPDVTKTQDRTFSGDRYIGGSGAYPEVWMMRDVPKGAYRVYYKVMKFSAVPTDLPTIVEGRFVSGGEVAYFPKVVVRKVGELFHVATITSEGEGKFSVKAELPDSDFEVFAKERDEMAAREQKARDDERRRQEEQKKTQEQNKDEQKKQ